MEWGLLVQLLVNGLIVGALYGVVAMSFVRVSSCWSAPGSAGGC